jgi:hypothetical protein
MTNFETIAIFELSTVTGGNGEGAPNREEVRVGVQGGRNRIIVGVEGTRTRTDYALCVQETRQAGGTPRDIRETCGLPPQR